MIKVTHLYFALLTAVSVALISCNKDDEQPPVPNFCTVTERLTQEGNTRTLEKYFYQNNKLDTKLEFNIHEFGHQDTLTKTMYTHDAQGRIISSRRYDVFDSLMVALNFEYNAAGQLIRQTVSDPLNPGAATDRYLLEYNANGQVTKIHYNDVPGTIYDDYYDSIDYDAAGKPVSLSRYRSHNQAFMYAWALTFDDKKNPYYQFVADNVLPIYWITAHNILTWSHLDPANGNTFPFISNTYQYNASGYPTTATSQGPGQLKYDFVYNCQ